MITEDRAREIVSKAIPNCTIKRIGKYKDGYLVFAPNKTSGDLDDNSPYYFTNGKKVGKFCPTSDLVGFRNAFKGQPLIV